MEKDDLILDVCSGLNGWSNVWKKAGFKVDTLDLNPFFKPTYCMDVRDFKPEKEYKVIFSSPPCTFFSFARNYLTTDEERKEGLEIAKACFRIAEKAEYYIVENPYWKKSLQYYIKRKNHHIVDYCMYGYGYKKPTSLWSNIPIEYRKCIHKFNSHPSSKMLYSSKQRAKIPVSLAQHVFDTLNK